MGIYINKMPATIAITTTAMIVQNHHVLKIDFFSPTTGVTAAVVAGCVATGVAVLTGTVFVSPTIDIIGIKSL